MRYLKRWRITHTSYVLRLALESGHIHRVGNGINHIAHIIYRFPLERISIALQSRNRAKGAVGLHPCHSRIERRRGIDILAQVMTQLLGSAVKLPRQVAPGAILEIDHAIDATLHGITHDEHLVDILVEIPVRALGHALHRITADIDMAIELLPYLAPPLSHASISSSRVPVNLRGHEVDSATRYPRHGVAENLVILPVAARAWIHAILRGYRGIRAGHACGTYAETHPWLGVLHHLVHIVHHHVHILTTPVALRHGAALAAISVIQGRVKVHRGTVLIIEVVVKHQSVTVILRDDVLTHIHNALAYLGQTRIEHRFVIVLHEPLGVSIDIVQFALSPQASRLRGITIRIDPGINLDAAFVSLLNEIGKGVECRSLATLSAHQIRPWFVGRVIVGIAHSTHMKVNGIHVVHIQRVEHLLASPLHGGSIGLSNGASRPVAHIGTHPHAALFALDLCLNRVEQGAKCYGQQ